MEQNEFVGILKSILKGMLVDCGLSVESPADHKQLENAQHLLCAPIFAGNRSVALMIENAWMEVSSSGFSTRAFLDAQADMEHVITWLPFVKLNSAPAMEDVLRFVRWLKAVAGKAAKLVGDETLDMPDEAISKGIVAILEQNDGSLFEAIGRVHMLNLPQWINILAKYAQTQVLFLIGDRIEKIPARDGTAG